MTEPRPARPAIGVVNVRDLARETSKIADDLEHGISYLLTRRGVPIATVTPIDKEALEDFILANAPEFVASMREADEALAAGETVPLSTYLEKSRTKKGPTGSERDEASDAG